MQSHDDGVRMHVACVWAPSAVEKLPAEHGVQSEARPAPTVGEKRPAAHCRQTADDVAAESVAYVPAEQARHAPPDAPTAVEYEPGTHVAHTDVPPLPNVPGGHGSHWAAVAPAAEEYRPAAHAGPGRAVSLEKEVPGGHSVHAVVAAVDWGN